MRCRCRCSAASLPEKLARKLNDVVDQLTNPSGAKVAVFGESIDAERFAAMRYTVIRREGAQRIGTFSRVTGALMACGHGILRAGIETIDNGSGLG